MQMEHKKWANVAIDESALAPIFICGLARSGSTLLLNRLNATGAFSTSTYRHMPFVLAPNMWSGASKAHRKGADAVERAHGDGMTHSFDSEEAFEEVFWRAVDTSDTNASTLPWNAKVTGETLAQFRLFMISVTKAGTQSRYLSKNNTNITRIPSLLKSASTAQVVIPFRHPVHFAGSTLSQHQKFVAGHAVNPFDARYMAWLGHHEFGPFFKPFAAPSVSAPADIDADYLCQYWTAVYAALLENSDGRVHFFDYDAFCLAPEIKLAQLGTALSLAQQINPPNDVHPPRQYDPSQISPTTLAASDVIYSALQNRAIA